MTYFEALAQGTSNVLSWPGILIPVVGTLLSMVTSFLPGIGSASLMALMLVLTLSWEPESVLLMFGALTGGATFMGSITAILFNIPGGAPSAAALLDGHPLAVKGYPKTAIACAATASAVGSVFGVAVLLATLPVIRPLLLEFGPLERMLLGLWGLTTIVAVPNTPPLKSLLMAALGLMASMIGSDPNTSDPRWTFGLDALRDGIGVLPALLGLFTLAELADWRRREALRGPGVDGTAPRDSVREGIRAVFRHPGLTLRSSLIGTLVGIVPGVGGTVAGFLAYGQAANTGRGDRSGFGKGDIRGVIAPEAAVDAKDGGSLLPAVAFGLPGSEAGVVLVTVLALHGLVPGTPMLNEQLPMTMTLILALLLSNILTSVVGVLATPQLARLHRLDIDRLALPALVVSVFAVVQVNGSLGDFHAAIAFGVLGYVFKRHGWPRVPFVIAFVLGEFIETNLTLSLRLAELGRVDLFDRPASLVILTLTLVSMAWMYRKTGSGERAPQPTGGDTLVAGLAAGCAALFAASALFGDQPASPVAMGVVALAFGLASSFIARGVRAGAWFEIGLPDARQRALWSLLLLPLAAWSVGLAPALGLQVFGWMAAAPVRRPLWAATAAATGLAVAGLAHWFALEWANLLLPRGALLDWLWPVSGD